MTNRLVDAKVIGERLGVPASWVAAKARDGAIPHVRLGRYVRFDVEAVNEWVASSMRPGRPVQLRRLDTDRDAA
jgi:excisionase family DNA binding protein